MKNLLFLIMCIIVVACTGTKTNNRPPVKLEITKIDYIKDHFVFTTKNNVGRVVTVLAERKSVSNCKPFKKFIIFDSIHQVSDIKFGSRHDLVGFNVSVVDNIKIKDSAQLPKIVRNCNCFIDE